jgi:predicted regulator of Ras-like GTPase activity (Roadblock/LC7/MglB family)
MEGLRQLDEKQRMAEESPQEENINDILSNLSPSDSAIIQELMAQKELDTMASKSEQLQSILNNIIQNSTEIVGAAVVDNDGLLLASALSGPIDGNRVAAVSAGLISLASRSAQQLNQGSVTRTLIQAEQGNVIAIRAGTKASLVALTPTGVNLGMAFLECGDAVTSVQSVL